MREHVPLHPYTSWRIGGPARYFTDVTSPDALQSALDWGRTESLPIFVLGGGTNLLIPDHGFDGLVIRYRAREMTLTHDGDDALVEVAAGASMAGTARRLAHQGWQGLEWAEGLPGTVGGAVYGNAGCYGGDIASVLVSADILINQTIESWTGAQMDYGYRTSLLKRCPPSSWHPPVILSATVRLRRGDPADLRVRMEELAARRKQHTPIGHTCGSVFKNPSPPSPAAGALIDQAGLKGTRIGDAEISSVHANYIRNLGQATSDDVMRLIDHARTVVLQQMGVALALEIQFLGQGVDS